MFEFAVNNQINTKKLYYSSFSWAEIHLVIRRHLVRYEGFSSQTL